MAEVSEEEKERVQNMIDNLVERAKKASREYLRLNQEQVNELLKKWQWLD